MKTRKSSKVKASKTKTQQFNSDSKRVNFTESLKEKISKQRLKKKVPRTKKSAFAAYLSDKKEQVVDEKETKSKVPSEEVENESCNLLEFAPSDEADGSKNAYTDLSVLDSEYDYISDVSITANSSCPQSPLKISLEDSVQDCVAEMKFEDNVVDVMDYDEVWKVLPIKDDRSCVLLCLKAECEGVKIFGQGSIEVIKGQAMMFGHRLNQGCKSRKFNAPVSHPALVFRPQLHGCLSQTDDSIDEKEESVWNYLNSREELLQINFTEEVLENYKVIALVSSLGDTAPLPTYNDLYKVQNSDGHVKHALSTGSVIVETEKYFQEYPGYQNAVKSILKDSDGISTKSQFRHPVIVTVGGKGTGKSTFNQYLVNRLLDVYSCVYYFDCDIGQPEFTPSGMISLSCVTEPILGPSFTHQQTPESAVFYGDIAAGDNPTYYVECVRRAFSKFISTNCPLVVNTMGWNRALGLHLLMDTIRMVDPSHIIQMVSGRESKDLPLLTKSYLADASGWKTNNTTGHLPKHKLTTINADIKTNEIVVYKSSDMRELRLLAYLREMQTRSLSMQGCVATDLSLSSLCGITPYQVKMSDVILCVSHERGLKRDLALSLFNCSVVGLCRTSQEQFKAMRNEDTKYLPAPPVCECFGLGIVRGVDPRLLTLYVLSGLETEILKRVNCLVLGAVCIPESLYESYNKLDKKSKKSVPPYAYGDLFQTKGSSKFRVYRSFVSK